MTKRTGSMRSKQTGNVMLSVMVISAILMGIGATLYNNYIVSEADAVEKSLVDARVYWAMIGNNNLLLGRVSGRGIPCNSSGSTATLGDLTQNSTAAMGSLYACATGSTRATATAEDNTERVGALQYYYDGDVQFHDGDGASARGISSPGTKTWKYPVETFGGDSGEYKFAIQSVVRQRIDPANPAAQYSQDGYKFRGDYIVYSMGSIPVLSDLVDRFPRLAVGFCVVDQRGTDPTLGQTCGSPPAMSEGYNRIEFLQWNMAIP